MSTERNRELLTQWYTALEEGDWQTISDAESGIPTGISDDIMVRVSDFR